MKGKKKPDPYADLAAKIVEMMKEHGAGWKKQWVHWGQGGLPQSISTGKQYLGMNRLILWLSGRSDARWGVYGAWTKLGAQVKKGEKGTPILAPRTFTTENAKGEEESKTVFSVLYVFNAEQVDNAPEIGERIEYDHDPIEEAELFIANTGARIEHGGDSACYSPIADKIKMPLMSQFADIQAYYGVHLHELTHWTGHSSRCDRDLANPFGSEEYAFEELVAELGATFLCSDLGIEETPREDHAQYLSSWITKLEKDPKAIGKAAKLAQKACEHLHSLQEIEQEKAA